MPVSSPAVPGLIPTAEPMFTIYGKALLRRSEAKDNALIRVLIFIDDALGYKIGDVKYVDYLLLQNINIR